MKAKHHKLFTFLLAMLAACTSLFSQADTVSSTPRLIQFSGYALTADSLMGVPFAHITVMNRGRVATAGPDGFFSFAARLGDTLFFTCIGYKPTYYILPKVMDGDKFSVIQMMTRDNYYLPETVIYPWGDREGFRRAFVTLELVDDNLERAKRNMERKMLAELAETLENDGGEATDRTIRATSAKTYYYGQAPPQNIFNPLAWAEFIRSWKRGDYKKK